MKTEEMSNLPFFKLYRPLDMKGLCELYFESTTESHRHRMLNLFSVDRTQDGRGRGRVKFTTSLFAQNHDFQNKRIPDGAIKTAPFMDPDGCDRHLVEAGWIKKGRSWWHTYLRPILEFDDYDVDLEVYVCPLIWRAARNMLPERHTYKVMKAPTIRHNPGAMWRFLGLESSKPVYCVDSDALPYSLSFHKEWMKSSRPWFRRAHCCDRDTNNFDDDSVFYHPMTASEFACRENSFSGDEKVLLWLCAFYWAGKHNLLQSSVYHPSLEKMCNLFGRHPHTYGFDELFLMFALFPKAFREGLFSVFPPEDRRTMLSRLDIDACRESENHSIKFH